MADPKLLAMAKQGDAIALQTLLNHSLRPYGIWARIERQNTMLSIALESTTAPEADVMEARIRAGIERLQPQGIVQIKLSGLALGELNPDWERSIRLNHGTAIAPPRETIAHPQTPDIQTVSATNTPSWYTPISLSSSDNPAAHAPASPLRSPTPEASQPRPISSKQQRSPTPLRRSKPRSTRRRSQRPFVITWSDFDPMMLAIIGFVAVFGFLGARDPSYDGPFMWLHYSNLAIHETGHLLFMPFGHFLMVLGGSLTQIAFPAVFTGYFFHTRQLFSSALTLFWTGQNFMDVAVYMADAPYRALPLTNPNIDAHDWWQLFNLMNCMNQAELIASITHWIGILIYLVSVLAGIYVAYRHQQEMNAQQQV